MLITIKNLQQQTFKFEFDETKTVLEFKELIKDSVKCPTNKQKLIYAGIFMEDQKTIKSYNVTEEKFIVFMASKAKPKPTIVVQEVPEPAVQSKPKNQETVKKVEKSESILLVGDEYNQIVENIMLMCVTTREVVEQALRASFNNPDRAVEYIINRQIPDVNYDQRELENVPVNSRREQTTDILGFLRNQKEFQAMKRAITENPELLQSIIQSIGETNPALLKLITENQDEFVTMLNEPIISESQLIITAEDRLAINRLKDLGYSEEAVLEAYFACDKNEELAANFLCSN